MLAIAVVSMINSRKTQRCHAMEFCSVEPVGNSHRVPIGVRKEQGEEFN